MVMFNKNMFHKDKDRKVLHKIKKRWAIISLASFMLIGGLTPSANASTDRVTEHEGTSPESSIMLKANALYHKIYKNILSTQFISAKAAPRENHVVKKLLHYTRPYYLNHMNGRTLKKILSMLEDSTGYIKANHVKILKRNNRSFYKGFTSANSVNYPRGLMYYSSDCIIPPSFIETRYLHNNEYIFGFLVSYSNNINEFNHIRRQVGIARRYKERSLKPYTIRYHHHDYINVGGFALYHNKHLSKNYKKGYADSARGIMVKKLANNKKYESGWKAGFRNAAPHDDIAVHKHTPAHYYNLIYNKLYGHHYKKGIVASLENDSDINSDIGHAQDANAENPGNTISTDRDNYEISGVKPLSKSILKNLSYLRRMF